MASESVSTQNTQYDKIGTKYNFLHDLPAVQPEEPSVRAVLGNIEGLRCLGKFPPSWFIVSFLFIVPSSLGAHT
jgi:hypothetical protein